MILIAKPQLKVHKNKLHVSWKPECTAWLLLGLSAVIFIRIFSLLMSNIYFLTVLLLGEIMFVLDIFGEWEDLILYKRENKAVIKKSIWSDKLCFNNSGEVTFMRLTDIRHVGVSTEMGLFILHRNGQTITLNVRSLTREEIQDLKKEINYFLNTSRLKHLDHCLIDSSNGLLLASESEEHLQNRPKVHLPTSNELTVSDNVLGRNKTCYRMQQNLSYPTLMRGIQLNYQPANLRRSPYTENSMHSDYVRNVRNICAAPLSRNLFKFNKERN